MNNSPTHITVGAAGTSGGVAGALVVIIAWIMSWWHIEMPAEVAAAFVTIIGGLGVYLSRFLGAATAGNGQPAASVPPAPPPAAVP